jgi:signal peptidase I
MTERKDFFEFLHHGTEELLTRRAKRRLSKKMKQQAKNPIVDWIEAILWAACVVLIVNQYLFQAYRIPSGSMIDSLLIGDMIFVDKLSYGPELLPGMAKLPGAAKPKRGRVVIFENPTYLSRGPAYTILQQMLYMLTLTLVDIDKDENGEPRVHYLIKRAIGMPGDRLRITRGNVSYRFAGTDGWVAENESKTLQGFSYNNHRSVREAEYAAIDAAGVIAGYREAGILPPESITATGDGADAYKDGFAFEGTRAKTVYSMYPHDSRFSAAARRYDMGWYIPAGRIFPMGDNRDNSRDARYFGPVAQKKVLGKALFIYWPPGRAGSVR